MTGGEPAEKEERLQFDSIIGPDETRILTINGSPVLEHEDQDKINLQDYKGEILDEELNITIKSVDRSGFVDFVYDFEDLNRKATVRINNCEFESKYIRNAVMQYYPRLDKDTDIWCITYYRRPEGTKMYISTKLLPVDMLKDLTAYSRLNNNILLKDIYDNFVRFKRNYYFKPRFTIFISHSSKDKIIVSDLYALMKNLGYELYYDLDFVQGVTTLAQNIKLALRRSTVILVLITPDSVASEWVKAEHEEMKHKYKLYLSYNCSYDKAEELGINTKKYHVRRIDRYNPFSLSNTIDEWMKNIDFLDV